MNHYELLGITPAASEEVIKKACKKMTRAVNDLDKTKQEKDYLIHAIHQMRDCLSDPAQRRSYDASIGIETVPVNKGHDGHEEPWVSDASPMWLTPIHRSGYPEPIARSSGRYPERSSGRSSQTDIVPFSPLGIFSAFNSLSIVPQELEQLVSAPPARGCFTFVEYSRKRVSDGWEESGVHRSGDLNNEDVTERRFARHKSL